MNRFKLLSCFWLCLFVWTTQAQPIIPYTFGDTLPEKRLDTTYRFALRPIPYPRMPPSRKPKPQPFSMLEPSIKEIKKKYKRFTKEKSANYQRRIERVYSVRLEAYWKQQAQHRAQTEAFYLDSIRYEQSLNIYQDSIKLYDKAWVLRANDSAYIAHQVQLFYRLIYEQRLFCTQGASLFADQWLASWQTLDQNLAITDFPLEKQPLFQTRYPACSLDTSGYAQAFSLLRRDTVCWYSPEELATLKNIVVDYNPQYHPQIADVYFAWRGEWLRWRPYFARVNEVQALLEARQRSWLSQPSIQPWISRWKDAKALMQALLR